MVVREEKTENFTVMCNYHFQDQNLSLKAKGLLSLMLSLPDDTWNYSLEGLAKLVRDGVDSVRTTLKELIKYGYVETSRVRDEKGRLGAAEYVIHEKSVFQKAEDREPVKEEAVLYESEGGKTVKEFHVFQETKGEEAIAEELMLQNSVSEETILGNPILENPILGNPILENQAQLNTNIYNTNILNTNISNHNAADIKPIKKLDSRRAYYPENEQLDKAFRAFIYMRKRINKPMTNTAIGLTKNLLVNLAGEDGKLNIEKAIGILNQSIMNSWQGLYELKTPIKNKEQPSGYSAYSAKEWEHLENLVLAN